MKPISSPGRAQGQRTQPGSPQDFEQKAVILAWCGSTGVVWPDSDSGVTLGTRNVQARYLASGRSYTFDDPDLKRNANV